MSENIHPFEAAGLGKAPFTYVGMWEMPSPTLAESNPEAYKNSLASMPSCACGSCNFCGTPIVYNHLIKSADGKLHAIGCDCVHKAGDAELTQKMERQLSVEKDRENRERRASRDMQYVLANLETIEEKRRLSDVLAWENEQKAKKSAAENAWLINALKAADHTPGGFITSMINTLHNVPLNEISPKAIRILCDIYAKAHGRRGSKAYNAACDEFDTHCPWEY